MANGGRIKHHLKARLGNERTLVLFTGFQAEGTLGRDLIEGNPTVSIYGEDVPVAAKIEKMNALSAHADQGEMLHWLSFFKTAPKKTFIVHGEPAAQQVLAEKIRQELGWHTEIPEFGDRYELGN
jgi:metallo-beta-lactamase family protein